MHHIDPLERRELLTVTLTNGHLAILGTSANDQITVSRSKTKVTVTEKTVQVSGNQTIITLLGKKSFAISAVDQVFIQTGDGDDTVSLTGSKTNPFSFPATLDGGNGLDRLTGGAGADRLVGGPGNDRLTGGAGNDTLIGDAGGDRLYGNDGNDQLFGGADADQLTGGNGSDLFDGGLANDRFYADDGVAGNDTLRGGGADIPAKPKKTSGDYAEVDTGDSAKDIRRVLTVTSV
jgi:Ca2+-binding RTX toxin-like protein